MVAFVPWDQQGHVGLRWAAELPDAIDEFGGAGHARPGVMEGRQAGLWSFLNVSERSVFAATRLAQEVLCTRLVARSDGHAQPIGLGRAPRELISLPSRRELTAVEQSRARCLAPACSR